MAHEWNLFMLGILIHCLILLINQTHCIAAESCYLGRCHCQQVGLTPFGVLELAGSRCASRSSGYLSTINITTPWLLSGYPLTQRSSYGILLKPIFLCSYSSHSDPLPILSIYLASAVTFQVQWKYRPAIRPTTRG